MGEDGGNVLENIKAKSNMNSTYQAEKTNAYAGVPPQGKPVLLSLSKYSGCQEPNHSSKDGELGDPYLFVSMELLEYSRPMMWPLQTLVHSAGLF